MLIWSMVRAPISVTELDERAMMDRKPDRDPSPPRRRPCCFAFEIELVSEFGFWARGGNREIQARVSSRVSGVRPKVGSKNLQLLVNI